MTELRIDARMALARYESSFAAFGEEASFPMKDVHMVQEYINRLETSLRKCHTALEVAFDYDGDDVFGMMHNDAVDASMEAERLLGIK
jgi:hypothetical protein